MKGIFFDLKINRRLTAPSKFPAAKRNKHQADVDGCLLPSAGELSPWTTPTMTRSLRHALHQLPSPDTSLLLPLPEQAAAREDTGIRCSDSPITIRFENMCVVHKNTHAHTHLLDTLLPGTSEEAEPVTDRNGGGKRCCTCVFFCRQLRRTHQCLNLPFSHKHNGEITRKLPGRQEDVSHQTPHSSLPWELIRFEAHAGTLSFASECTRYSTLIPFKPLQLM